MPIYKTNTQKDGKQKYKVRINYMDNLGQYRQITRIAYGKEEAKLLERQLESDIRQTKPAARLTVYDLYNEYVKSMQTAVRETTLEKTKTIVKNHILPTLGNTPLDKLTAPVLNKWKQDIENKGLALQTKKNAYSAFRALLNFAVRLDYLQTNILLKVGNFKDANYQKRKMDFYTSDEFIQYINEARKIAVQTNKPSDWDFYTFFAIAFYTGLRKGEIHALKWSDLKGNILSVSRSINQKLKGGDRETPPKNKSSVRKLQIPAPLLEILKEHKKIWKKQNGFTEDYRICGGTKPLRDTSIENKNKQLAELAGLKKIRIHDFRHSHASVLIHNGINIQEISRRLGHSDIKETLNTYSHLYPKEEEKAVEILNKIL